MDQVIAGLVLLALVPVVWWLMLRSWRRRSAQQAAGTGGSTALPAPRPLPAGAGDAWDGESGDQAARRTVTGTYVSTVLSGRPFERVTAHGLGSPSRVELEARAASGEQTPQQTPQQTSERTPEQPALLLRRSGAASFSIPAADLVRVSRARGQAGKVMFGKEDLVVVTWRLGGAGGVEVDSAVRTKPQQDAPRLVALVEGLIPSGSTTHGKDAA